MKKHFSIPLLIGILILLPFASASYTGGDPMLEAGFISSKEKVMAPSFYLNIT